jgi:NTE family protein
MKRDLRAIPFFSVMPDDVLDAIAQRLQREHYHKDAVIFSEDDPGDCMYIIETGQVKIVSEKGGRERIYSYLGPGNFFGETALLLGEKRSATVRVVLDTELLVLRKQDLEDLLQQHPGVAIAMTRELGRRLVRTTQKPEEHEEFNLVAVFGTATPTLARYLAELTGEQVCLLDLGGLANVTLGQESLRRKNVALDQPGNALTAEQLAERLGQLVEQYYWVLLAVAPYETPLTLKATELADVTVLLGVELPWIKDVLSKRLWRAKPDDASLRRLARRIAQRQVGLALSSGNARGFAHIGVLKVLEEAGVPIDLLAATSAGAIFGAMYAVGRTIADMTTFAVNVQRQYNFRTGFRYWDFQIPPRSGLIRGNMVLKYLAQWVKDRTFDQASIPLYIVATDLISGEEIVFDRGPIAEAMRASMSVIGVFEPAHVAGRFLIDGGSVNPVPTQLLADHGANIILASNVIPSLEDRIHRRELKREGRVPNVIGIVMGAMEIMESEIIKTRLGPVDVLIQPEIARFGTLEYDKAWELIRCGEEAAREQLANIQRLLTPHPRKPLQM